MGMEDGYTSSFIDRLPIHDTIGAETLTWNT